MQITDMLLTPNPYSRPQTKLTKVTKIAVHYVGNPGSTAAGNRNYFESLKDKELYASSHYVVGLNGEIVRCVPENEIAYCTNSANSYSISIECCHPGADGKFNDKTYSALLELCADLCKRYKLDPLSDMIRHYDVTGKMCPLYYVKNPSEWEAMKANVAKLITYQATQVKPPAATETPGAGNVQTTLQIKDAIDVLVRKGVISSPDYWMENYGKLNYLDKLIINAAKALEGMKP